MTAEDPQKKVYIYAQKQFYKYTRYIHRQKKKIKTSSPLLVIFFPFLLFYSSIFHIQDDDPEQPNIYRKERQRARPEAREEGTLPQEL